MKKRTDTFEMKRGMFWLCVTRLNGAIIETEKLVFKYEEGGSYRFLEYGTDNGHTTDNACFPFHQWKRSPTETMTSTYLARSRTHRVQKGDVVFYGHITHDGQQKKQTGVVASVADRSFKIAGHPSTFRKADGYVWGRTRGRGLQVFDVWTRHKMLSYVPRLIDRLDELAEACKPDPIWPPSKLWSGHWETIHENYPVIIVGGEVKEHVGIGWITLRDATEADYLTIPELRNPNA